MNHLSRLLWLCSHQGIDRVQAIEKEVRLKLLPQLRELSVAGKLVGVGFVPRAILLLLDKVQEPRHSGDKHQLNPADHEPHWQRLIQEGVKVRNIRQPLDSSGQSEGQNEKCE